MRRRFAVFLAGLLALVSALALALEIPAYESPVTDLDGLLSNEARSSLNQKLLDYRAQSGNELGVLIIPTLDGETLEDYTHKVYNKWGIGKKDSDKGALFLMAVKDKKARIEVGYGMEGDFTDAEASRIVRRDSPMAQYFRQGDWDRGITAVVDGMIQAIGGEYDPPAAKERGKAKGLPIGFLMMLAFFGLIMVGSAARFLQRGGSGKNNTGSLMGAILLGSMLGGRGGRGDDWHLGGGSNSGGGGGFSFGGGSSGGGGASGGW